MRKQEMETALVTGGAGFVGAHLVRSLIDSGRRVVVADWCNDLAHSPLGILAGEDAVTYRRIDLSNLQAVRTLRDEPFGTVFHLAGQPIGWRSAQERELTFRSNVETTRHMLDVVREGSAARMVFASSACAFGVPPTGASPLKEFDQKCDGIYPYTASKQEAEALIDPRIDAVAIVRFVNIFGEADWHLSRLVPRVVGDLLAGKEPKLRRSASATKLDFLYVGDAVAGLLATEKHLVESSDGREIPKVFHFGTDGPVSLGEIVEEICALHDGEARSPAEPRIPAEPTMEKFLDASLSRQILGWSPRLDRTSALARTIAWYRSRGRALADVDARHSTGWDFFRPGQALEVA